MTDELVLSQPVAITISKEIDGLEMGVLSDGQTYLSGRSLARLCGVAPSAIINQGRKWLDAERDGKLAQMLVARGLERPSLYVEVEAKHVSAGKIHAYTDDVCMAILEYYAFESTPQSPQAQQNFRKLAQAGLRFFVYQALGYDPAKRVPLAWRQFHDRLLLHSVPSGHFSVFKECSDFVLASIRGGLPVDEHTIPDISVGVTWAKHWETTRLEERFGKRVRHEHNYPDYFPQAASNPQPMWVYPVDALGEFRRWLDARYIPEKFPTYLNGKVKKRLLSASTVELLLAEVAPVAALPSPPP